MPASIWAGICSLWRGGAELRTALMRLGEPQKVIRELRAFLGERQAA